MDSRERILRKAAAALRCGAPPDRAELARIRDRALGTVSPPRLAWSESPTERLLERHRAAAGTAVQVADAAALVEAVAHYLRERGLGERLRAAPHPWLDSFPWAPTLQVETNSDPAEAPVILSVAVAGVAETGSLVLASGPCTPSPLNLLPEHHLVLLRTDDTVSYLEDLWARLRAAPSFPPRALHLVTGPSRTADVEQTIQLGAHGPRSVHLLLYEGRS